MLKDAAPTLAYGHSTLLPVNNGDNSALLYKVFRGDNKLVRSLLEANCFTHTETHEWNILWSSGACKQYLYEGLNEYQKINHFPASQELTRKDRLAVNVRKMQERFSRQYFDFIPDTFVLPEQWALFCKCFNESEDTVKNQVLMSNG